MNLEKPNYWSLEAYGDPPVTTVSVTREIVSACGFHPTL
ncbi:hypothetical protein [Sphingomonas phage Carli]|nr:hypothetical protein [Sphingomonas phage Carli]